MSFRPVDTSFGNQIVAHYLATIAANQHQQEIGLQKDQLDQQKELELKRLEAEHDYHQQQIELQKSQLDLASHQFEVQKQSTTQDIVNKYLQTGATPVGAIVEKPALNQPPDPGMLPISQTPGLGVDDVRLNIPNLGSVTTLNPIEAAKQRGNIALEEAKPKLVEEEKKQQEIGQREFQKSILDITAKASEGAQDRSNKLAIANIEANSRLAEAKTRTMGEFQRTIATNSMNKFDNSPIVKSFNIAKEANDTVNLPNASDMDLLFAYGKALNPSQAATPEGIIAIGQQLPSFAARLGLKIGNISNDSKFLDANARKQILNTIGNTYNLYGKAYDNLKTQSENEMKTVGVDPKGLLKDYRSEGITGVDSIVNIGGKKIKITKLYPDGTFDGDEVK